MQSAEPPVIDTTERVDSLPYHPLMQELLLSHASTRVKTVEGEAMHVSAQTSKMLPASPSMHTSNTDRKRRVRCAGMQRVPLGTGYEHHGIT